MVFENISLMILIMCGVLLIRIFIKKNNTKYSWGLIAINIVDVFILIIFNVFMYMGSEGYRTISAVDTTSYLLIFLILLVNAGLIFELYNRNKKGRS